MKILGIDYGEKRIGLAISDETETLARELKIVEPKTFWQTIASLIETENIGMMVVGLPLNMDGRATKQTEETNEFIQELKKRFSISIEAFDERLSSKMAQNIIGGSNSIDSMAAQIILQNYLDKQKSSP